MGFFSSLFGGRNTPTQTNNDSKFFEHLSLFKEVSTAFMSEDVLNDKDNQLKIALYFFGASDYISQAQQIDETETLALYTTFLMMDLHIEASEAGSIVGNILANQSNPDYSKYIMLGGNSIYNWVNGDNSAPAFMGGMFL